VPAAPWSFTATVENATWARTFAGMVALGPKGRVYIIRNATDRGSIVGSTLARSLFQRPDLPGNPPLTLRLWAERGSLHAAAGASLSTLEPLPVDVPLAELGEPLLAGLATGRGLRRNDGGVSPLRIHSVALEVTALAPWRPAAP
jgi:hypothetical protein